MFVLSLVMYINISRDASLDNSSLSIYKAIPTDKNHILEHYVRAVHSASLDSFWPFSNQLFVKQLLSLMITLQQH